MAIIVAATLVALPPAARGAVLLTGSHGGRYAGSVALSAGVRAAVFHDAGLGLDEAGVASLPMFDDLGVPAAAVGHETARVGDARDMLARGRLTRVNAAARALGVRPGMACADALAMLETAADPSYDPPRADEARSTLPLPGASRAVVLVDSAALVSAEVDRDAIVVTGSHGGLAGDDPAARAGAPAPAAFAPAAFAPTAFAMIFHDAGIGIDQAGIGCLPPLDDHGIAGLVADGMTCRIGDAQSVFDTGVVSACNETAARLGAAPGMGVREVALNWAGWSGGDPDGLPAPPR